MIQRRFSENHRISSKINRSIAPVVSQIMLLLGSFILIFGLIYMMMNLSRSDSVIVIWIPFMITGVALIFMSQIMKPKKETNKEKTNHKHSHF
jgi:hypothetical protein